MAAAIFAAGALTAEEPPRNAAKRATPSGQALDTPDERPGSGALDRRARTSHLRSSGGSVGSLEPPSDDVTLTVDPSRSRSLKQDGVRVLQL